MSGPRPIVYAGPTISADEVEARLPGCDVRPPVARGHLYDARKAGATTFLIIDGTFSHGFAVSPREVVDVITDGALVVGSSSMGAIRGAECWPAGMQGIGAVYRLYRIGALRSDDEVAVTTDPDAGYAATSLALVNVRHAARRARRAGVVDRAGESAIVAAAQALHFSQRRWSTILKASAIDGDHERIVGYLETCDLKLDDARRSLTTLARLIEAGDGPAAPAPRHDPPVFTAAVRYPGHDRFFGLGEDQARHELAVWLFGSGRYQLYIWAAVAGEPELGSVVESSAADAGERPGALREGLAAILTRWLAGDGDSDITGGIAETRMWHELAYVEELDAELARWHAARILAESHLDPAPRSTLRRVREEVAIAHGANSWTSLVQYVEGDRLFGAIPMRWIEEACDLTARARAAAAAAATATPRAATADPGHPAPVPAARSAGAPGSRSSR